MRRLIASSTVLALAAAGAVAAAPPGSARVAGAGAARTEPTGFAMKMSGYGTRVKGGQVPAGSGTTAFQVIGCTNKAGLSHENHQAQQQIPGLGTASGLKTLVWTTQKHGAVSAWARDTVSKVVLSDSPLGSLQINGISSQSRAFHDARGFHATTRTAVVSMTFTPTGGAPQSVTVPTPGQPAVIPGFGTVTLGQSLTHRDSDRASAAADGLLVDLTASGSKVRIAHSEAKINDGIKSGIFGGFASAARAKGLQGNTSIGHTPYQVMPCQGTDGKDRAKSIAHLDLGGQAVVDGLTTREKANQTARRAHGFTQGKVAGFDLGGGQVKVTGIVGRANVERIGSRLKRNIAGSQVGTVTVNGQTQVFPDTGVLTVPGVAELERNVVTKVPSGIQVVALRVTLLDGSGAVINLGEARLSIKPSGN